jgi:hypothetical protein
MHSFLTQTIGYVPYVMSVSFAMGLAILTKEIVTEVPGRR